MKETGKKIGRGLVLMLMLAAMASMTVLAADGDAPAPAMYATFASLVPPGCGNCAGAYYEGSVQFPVCRDPGGRTVYSGFQFEGTVTHIFENGFIAVLSDGYNVGILIFLVILGAMVSLMNRAGGSAAFGRWAKEKIKSPCGSPAVHYCAGSIDIY